MTDYKNRKGFLQGGGDMDGVGYTEGSPLAFKADMKQGEFLLLSQKRGGKKEVAMQVVKAVNLPKAVLFPHKDSKKPKDWLHLFFINENGRLCATLHKTYSIGEWQRCLMEMEDAGRIEEATINYTTVRVTMVVEEHNEGESQFKTAFYFAKDKDGKPCRYFGKDGNPADGVTIDWVSDSDYSRNETFMANNADKVYDTRTAEEYVLNNVPATFINNVEEDARQGLPYFFMYKLGYYRKEYLEAMIDQSRQADEYSALLAG